MAKAVQLGLGLIGIGRPWGLVQPEVPDEKDVFGLLEWAVSMGIRHFDTAPSYGTSEPRLGAFLKSLNPGTRKEIVVATKFGEHWDDGAGAPFADHSYDALVRSLELSLKRLGRIDILQLHLPTPQVLRSGDLARAWEFASSCGIKVLGASVKEPVSAHIVLEDPRYSVVQVPYNLQNSSLGEFIEEATDRDYMVVVNRPYAMGELLGEDGGLNKAEAFAFILRRRFRGVVLTGTKSVTHLIENIRAFEEAQRLVSPNA
jgi:aryl-alcohol dehydrogenase-like predicted oxidoreductase